MPLHARREEDGYLGSTRDVQVREPREGQCVAEYRWRVKIMGRLKM